MKRKFGRWSAVLATAAVTGWLFAVPLAAQERGGGHGGGGGAAGGGGHASGGSGGSSTAGASGGGTSSSGGSTTATSSGGATASGGSMAGGAHAGGRNFSAGSAGHERGGSGGGQARGGGSGQTHGGGAVARQPMGGTPSGGSTAAGGTTAGNDHATPRDVGASGRDAIGGGNSAPPYSRPRGDKPATGTAVPRTGPPPSSGGGNVVTGYPGYFPLGFGGLGYFGMYDPWGDPWGYDPYGGGYGGQYPVGGSGYDRDEGSVRLKVKPREAEVFVDGYYTGVVDEYDGLFQRLHIQAGPHRIELRAPGYEPLVFDVRVEPHQTLTFKGELKKIQ